MENSIAHLNTLKAEINSKHEIIKLLMEAGENPLSNLTPDMHKLLINYDLNGKSFSLVSFVYNELGALNLAYMEALKNVGKSIFLKK
ncbi:hypothetical protein [Pantoea sp.]|uniref:hypothetical protein n=1 Tax=Pantoea sp. TaxID=69393 RepID=UPI00290BE27F|nr:hypothetical protein [Pantoea sp.]MDU4126937.1 hypothetical protein [Pantoea sp.]